MILTAGLTDHHFLTILKNESLEKISLRMLTLKTIVLLSALAGNTYDQGKTQHIELGESSGPSSSIRRVMPSPFKKMFGERSGPRSICISPSGSKRFVHGQERRVDSASKNVGYGGRR